jgi:hypothetical protein
MLVIDSSFNSTPLELPRNVGSKQNECEDQKIEEPLGGRQDFVIHSR